MASQRLPATYRAVCSYRSLTLLLVGAFTAVYFAAICFLASLKPFGFDELTTYHIARTPTAAGVWQAWLESFDALPPLAHFATHFTGSVLGFSHITARLPDMLGYWLMCVCVFIFLRRRVCPMLALVGMLLPLTVPSAYAYAYEMRGYGMVTGFAATAIVCWDFVYDTRWRRVALLGLPISLAAAIGTHPYAVLVVIPLALGEIARMMQRRRVDWWVWMGLVVVGLMLLPANPITSHILHVPGLNYYLDGRGVGVSLLVELWPQFLSISATHLGLLAIVCIQPDRMTTANDSPAPITPNGQPALADWVLVSVLMALPAVGWLFANLVTGALEFRYVIAAVIGFSMALPLLCQVGVRRRPEIALVMAAWVAVSAAGSIVASWHTLKTTTITTAHIAAGQGCFRLLKVWGRLPANDLPIVVSDYFVFHQLHHYAPTALKPRLLFLMDPDVGGPGAPMAPFFIKVFGERMEALEKYLRSDPSFYLYDCGSVGKLPLVERLLGMGAHLRDGELVDTPDVHLRRELYLVSMKGGSPGRNSRR